MCGIVGFMLSEDKLMQMDVLEAMMEKIIHRGPDGSGSYYDANIALGHRRLSIIDIQGGVQPMKNEDGSLVCVFNGEIYNHKELRSQLEQRGHRFATKSDTEVLLHGYEEWGKELPLKLRGMFAFAIWDKKKKELFCARDYFGIKPFYYYQREDVFLFGSEIKSFLPHPQFEKKLNPEQLELYLTYQYSPGENTFFENVYKLPPAHFLLWKNGGIEIQRYWTPDFAYDSAVAVNETSMDDVAIDGLVTEIGKVMQNSVAAHKMSDVEVGSFLSSGMDSSYITKLSNVQKTFTIGFENEAYDEAASAHAFSQTIDVENTVYHISKEGFLEKLPEIQYYMDEPLADAASVALYFLNREASKQVKVCLSGEGADELFGGYNIYKEPFMCQKYDGLPDFLRRLIGAIAGWFPPVHGVNFLVRHGKPLSERYIGNTSLFTEREKRKLLKDYSGSRLPVELVNLHAPALPKTEDTAHMQPVRDEVSYMQLVDIHMWLVGDILLKADKMSMANSLELRVPFLDKEVFQVAGKIPSAYRVNAKETKIALRQAARPVIGSATAKKKKLGFPVPIRDWIREEPYVTEIKKCFNSAVAERFFRRRQLLRLLEMHVKGKRDCWREIWCVYVFLIWYKEYFE